jgi:Domain of unknown function (DUF4234)
MTDPQTPPPEETGATTPAQGLPTNPAPAMPGGVVVPAGDPAAVGKIRSTGTCFVLTIVTLGFYTWVWWFKTHSEMRRHTGEGIGGGIALVLAIFLGIVMPFFSSHEVGRLYERRGQRQPVTAVTGLWALLLGWFFFVGLIVWFVKTNDALNAYWRSLGAR